jgi:hypothetical protein
VAPCNNFLKDNFQSVSVFVLVPVLPNATTPIRVMEPDKCERWEWHDLSSAQALLSIFPSAAYLLKSGVLDL